MKWERNVEIRKLFPGKLVFRWEPEGLVEVMGRIYVGYKYVSVDDMFSMWVVPKEDVRKVVRVRGKI